MLCLSGFELYSRWVPLKCHFQVLSTYNSFVNNTSQVSYITLKNGVVPKVLRKWFQINFEEKNLGLM